MEINKQRRSTQIKHRRMYDRYKELVAADREKLGAPPQMLYQAHYYYRLSDEFGYDVKYISAILNRLKREDDAAAQRGI